jgi:hypothetical protein
VSEENIRQAKQVPVLINYVWEKEIWKKPDLSDIEMIQRIEHTEIRYPGSKGELQ